MKKKARYFFCTVCGQHWAEASTNYVCENCLVKR